MLKCDFNNGIYLEMNIKLLMLNKIAHHIFKSIVLKFCIFKMNILIVYK